MLSKAASSIIFWVFGMTRPGIERRSPGPFANTLLIRPMTQYTYYKGIGTWNSVIISMFIIIKNDWFQH